jgi:hypothetical protein
MPDSRVPDPTPAEFAAWLTPTTVLEVLTELGQVTAIEEVLHRAIAGLVLAAGEVSYKGRTEPRVSIQKDAWRSASSSDTHGSLWISGRVGFHMPDRESMDGVSQATFFDVRFEPAGIFAIPRARRPAPAHSPEGAGHGVPKRHPGGRPPWPGWEDVWVEIARQLYMGDLKPTKQADIETAMLELAEQSVSGPKITAIRTLARKLWQAIQREDEN